MKKFLMLGIPALVLTLTIAMVAHAFMAHASCTRNGTAEDGTACASAYSDSAGLSHGFVSAAALIGRGIPNIERVEFDTGYAQAYAFDFGPYTHGGFASARVTGTDNSGTPQDLGMRRQLDWLE